MTGNNVQRLKGGGNKGVIVGFFEVNSLALLSLFLYFSHSFTAARAVCSIRARDPFPGSQLNHFYFH